jgi:hypothetical protein
MREKVIEGVSVEEEALVLGGMCVQIEEEKWCFFIL